MPEIFQGKKGAVSLPDAYRQQSKTYVLRWSSCLQSKADLITGKKIRIIQAKACSWHVISIQSVDPSQCQSTV